MVLDETNEDKDGEALADEAAATVTFQNVQFSYTPGHPVLRDFTLEVPSGKKVALVGATGIGKTTVVNLLMRFYDVDSGSIRINQQDIQDAMQLVMQNRTSIVIADRLSTIRDADLIVVLDHGQIVEYGDHDTLLSKSGKYYELYMTQYAGFAT